MKSDFDNFVQENEESFNKFWSEEYPKLSKQEKVNYWLASTLKGMRTQGEVINDEYSDFSKEWYDFAKGVEPNFDEIFAEAVNNIGFEFNWKEYNNKIHN